MVKLYKPLSVLSSLPPPVYQPQPSHQRIDAAVGVMVAVIVDVHRRMLLVVMGGVLCWVGHRLIQCRVMVLPMVLHGVLHMMVMVVHMVPAGR